MATLIRFEIVEIYSFIRFAGKRKKILTYPVLSLCLVPVEKFDENNPSQNSLPEIYLQ